MSTKAIHHGILGGSFRAGMHNSILRASLRQALFRHSRARRKSQRVHRKELTASRNRILKIAVNVGLGGVLVGAYAYGKLQDAEKENVWVSGRGALSLGAPRPRAVVPMMACLGSGVIAAFVWKKFPTQAHVVRLGSRIHNLTALPMSILLAFRFQWSHDRWVTSRNVLENMTANAHALAMSSASSLEVKTVRKDLLPDVEKHVSRMVGLLDTFCWYAEIMLTKGKDPHPANMPNHWPGVDLLESPDREEISTSADPIHWCSKAIIETIYSGQELGIYSGDNASGMFDSFRAMLEDYHTCNMVVCQETPAPFVVHMRSLLLAFCFSFPFTMIGTATPLVIILKQFALSFSLLTVAACSMEMEHPFGDDEADIPCRLILAKTRTLIRVMGY